MIVQDKLIRACEYGEIADVVTLLKEGADVNGIGENSDEDKRTALGAAVENEHDEVVGYLLSVKGIDPNKTVFEGGFTPLMIAAGSNRYLNCIELLLQNVEVVKNINMTDVMGKNALEIANQMNFGPVRELIITRISDKMIKF